LWLNKCQCQIIATAKQRDKSKPGIASWIKEGFMLNNYNAMHVQKFYTIGLSHSLTEVTLY